MTLSLGFYIPDIPIYVGLTTIIVDNFFHKDVWCFLDIWPVHSCVYVCMYILITVFNGASRVSSLFPFTWGTRRILTFIWLVDCQRSLLERKLLLLLVLLHLFEWTALRRSTKSDVRENVPRRCLSCLQQIERKNDTVEYKR